MPKKPKIDVTFISKVCSNTLVSKGDPEGDGLGLARDKVEKSRGVSTNNT